MKPSEDVTAFERYCSDFQLGRTDGFLYRIDSGADNRRRRKLRMVIPESLQTEIICASHDDIMSGHGGYYKTLARVTRRFWWANMATMVKAWVATCRVCGARKLPSQPYREPLCPIETWKPMDMVSSDIVGPLPLTEAGNRYFLSMTCLLTKIVEFYPIPDLRAETVARVIVEEWILRYGIMLKLLSDQGGAYISKLFSEVCRLLSCRRLLTTPYYPACNGQAERNQKTIVNSLACYVSTSPRTWDTLIKYVAFSMRTATHESTRESPYYLLYGRDPYLNIEAALMNKDKLREQNVQEYVIELSDNLKRAWEFARQNIKRAQKRQKGNYDRKVKQAILYEGCKVWLHSPALTSVSGKKFAMKYSGPYRVVQLNRPNVQISPLTRPNQLKWVHINRVKPYLELFMFEPGQDRYPHFDLEDDELILPEGQGDRQIEVTAPPEAAGDLHAGQSIEDDAVEDGDVGDDDGADGEAREQLVPPSPPVPPRRYRQRRRLINTGTEEQSEEIGNEDRERRLSEERRRLERSTHPMTTRRQRELGRGEPLADPFRENETDNGPQDQDGAGASQTGATHPYFLRKR